MNDPAGNTAAPPAQWTTRTLLDWMRTAFDERGVDEPRRSAELLLEHVLGCERMKLYTQPDRPATPDERDALRTLVQRALQHEPIQYLIGEWSFMGVDLAVDPRVLIPRPATETIVTELLQHARRTGRVEKVSRGSMKPLGGEAAATAGDGAGAAGGHAGEGRVEGPREGGVETEIDVETETAADRASRPPADGSGVLIADVGTGSGCIAIAALKHMPGARGVATDISPDALAVARANADRHGLGDRLRLVQGDLLDALPAAGAEPASVDYLASNPPYIPDAEWNDPTMVGANVKGHEPERALRGGPDGLRFVRPIIEGAPHWLRPGGLLLVEVAASTADAARRIAENTPGLAAVRLVNDLDGLPRVVMAERG